MKLYFKSEYFGNYEITAIAETPEKCLKAIVTEYKRNFGSFRDNGFKNMADWLEYHGLDNPNAFWEVELNKAFTH